MGTICWRTLCTHKSTASASVAVIWYNWKNLLERNVMRSGSVYVRNGLTTNDVTQFFRIFDVKDPYLYGTSRLAVKRGGNH